ncbi:MAG TPA: hypothetical protein ENI27_05725 [bacterium]|nr:hypothetical protein [bacterium]
MPEVETAIVDERGKQKSFLDLVWGDDKQNRLNVNRALEKAGATKGDLSLWLKDDDFAKQFVAGEYAYLVLIFPKILQKLVDKAESGHIPCIERVLKRFDDCRNTLFGIGDKAGLNLQATSYVFNAFGVDSKDKLFIEAQKIISKNTRTNGDGNNGR